MSESTIPQDLRYSSDHEWIRLEGDTATVGITDYAQEALGDIVFVSLPSVGDELTAGQECGEVESTKSVSPLVSPLTGTVLEVNADLDGAPDLVNTAPYGDGWMFRVGVTEESRAQMSALLDADGYAEISN